LRRVAFVNASSGKILGNRVLQNRLEAACNDRAQLVNVSSEQELVSAVKSLPSTPELELGILGGDGTLMRVMSCLYRVRGPDRLPVIVPVPFGTVCTTSTRWRVGRSPWRVLDAWLHHRAMILRRKRTLAITIDGCAHIGCTVGTGLVARFFEHYEALGAHGLRTASKIAIASFFGSFVRSPLSRSIMQPTECSLFADGSAVGASPFTLIVSSVFADVGLGIKVTYRAAEDPERIALVSSSLPAQRLGPQFWRVLTGRPLIDPNGVNALVRQWALTFPTRGSVIIDGDRLPVQSLDVAPGPIWSVLTPAPHD
jgi:diacylglycerol kinase family enzyme